MSFILGLAGPTGSGKSTLARLLATHPNVGLVPEPLPLAGLEQSALSTREFGEILQEQVLSTKLADVLNVKHYKTVVIDRIVQEDREVFLQLHLRLGFLTPPQVEKLSERASEAERLIGMPQAVVLLKADSTVLRERMIRDGRPAWLVESLYIQLDLYSHFERRLDVPHLIVDTTDVTCEKLTSLADWILETVRDAATGHYATIQEFKATWEPPCK
ncbi:MAG TPA: deoxynucleoside kinase [Terriglobales bacterium]